MQDRIGKILGSELARRCERNPRYSLRSFAQALGISPANLSLLINGRRPASRKTIARILDRVELTARDKAALQKLNQKASEPVTDTIDLQVLEDLCHWQCYAILSLLQTADFESNETWIAKRLGVSVFEIKRSLHALIAADVIDVSETSWRQKTEIRINNQTTSATIRGFHRQLIDKALSAMEQLPPAARDISSITFAMSPEKMAQAKEEIRRFRLKMNDLLEDPGNSTEVYNLTVQLTPITTRRSNT